MKKEDIKYELIIAMKKIRALVFTFNAIDTNKVPLTEAVSFGFGSILSEIEEDLDRIYEELDSSMLIDLEERNTDEE